VLQLAEGTVKLHISAILRALGVDNRTRAVVAAARLLGLAQGEKPTVKPRDS
jgi:DNA-binding NarL/FixJ family response regulator